ncbi:MAG: hypothetical protein IPI97_13825 [Nitrosomonas sp.]|nr:hypothetical protein [Nitrosomonas sp.]
MYGDLSTPANICGSQAERGLEYWICRYHQDRSWVIDTGIDYTTQIFSKNIWINQKEISATLRGSLTDVDTDGTISFVDLNHAANVTYVSDLNNNGRIDAGDFVSRFTLGRW